MGKKITEEISNKIVFYREEENKGFKQIASEIETEFNIKFHPTTLSKHYNELEDADNDNEEGNKTKSISVVEEEKDNNVIEINNSIVDELNKSGIHDNSIVSEKKTVVVVEPINKQVIKSNNNESSNESITNIIRNVKSTNVEELKEKRKYIVIIRQYINTFKEKLESIYGKNKTNFEKGLFNMNISQLQIILENIRVELSIGKNKNLTIEGAKTILQSYEKLLCFSGVNIDGVCNELISDPDFMTDLQCIGCEINISDYITPKTSVFLKIMQKGYMKYEENKIVKNLDDKLDNPELLKKLQQLKK